MDTLCTYCGGGYQHQPKEEEIVPWLAGLMKGPEMSPYHARDACWLLVVMQCFSGSPEKLSRSYGHISWWARTCGKEGQFLLGTGSLQERGASDAVDFSAISVPHLHPSARLATEDMGGGFACLLPFISQLLLESLQDVLLIWEGINGFGWRLCPSWAASCCTTIMDVSQMQGPNLRLGPGVSGSGLFCCLAELCRKGFSQS